MAGRERLEDVVMRATPLVMQPPAVVEDPYGVGVGRQGSNPDWRSDWVFLTMSARLWHRLAQASAQQVAFRPAATAWQPDIEGFQYARVPIE